MVIKSNQTNYFIVRLQVDREHGQLSLPHRARVRVSALLK